MARNAEPLGQLPDAVEPDHDQPFSSLAKKEDGYLPSCWSKTSSIIMQLEQTGPRLLEQDLQHLMVSGCSLAAGLKFPLWDAVRCDGTFKTLVSLVSRNMSLVKKSQSLTEMDIIPLSQSLNLDYQPPRIAITCPPKLEQGCRLFPMEGSWDILYYFEENFNGVELTAIYDSSVLQSASMQDMKIQIEMMVRLSRAENTLLRDMTDWLPLHASLPEVAASPQGNPLRHVHHWFEEHADSNPDNVSLFSKEEGFCMTYSELNASAEAKASSIHMEGIQPRSRILIQLPRGPKVIEWVLAVLKHGSAFAYLDPDSPESQRLAVLSSFRPAMIVDESKINDIEISGRSTLQNISPSILDRSKFDTADNDLAYMIFTSGSTGQPKGVMVEHGNLAAFVRSTNSRLGCGFGTRILQLASFTFDASILEWSLALSTGACLCFAQHPQYLVGEYLADAIEENDVTFLQITPSALASLPLSRKLPSLSLVSIGGEAPSREIFEKWHSRTDLVNIYGPTEATIAVSLNEIRKTEQLPKFISAGQPNHQTTIYICDEGFGEVLDRGPGEICIAGPQIARGYVDMPETTAQNFAVHSNGIRMYRTGDRGMLLEDGSLAILGRLDRELKIRGFRIASEEIEKAVLEANVGCQAVSVQKSENGTEMIAVVSPATVSAKALLAALKVILPSYKVPSTVYSVPSLPSTVAGKIDHKSIRANLKNLCRSGDGARLLQNPVGAKQDHDCPEKTEQTICGIWQRVLECSSLPARDVNFFDVGGHSLLVPKLHDALSSAFPAQRIRMLDLFQQATVTKQAQLMGVTTQPDQVDAPAGCEQSFSSCGTSPMQEKSLDFSHATSASSSPTGILTPASNPATEYERIGIVGIAGRFPGAADVNEFYQNLMKGYSGIADLQPHASKKTLQGNVWVHRAGVLDNVEHFDNSFWNLSEEEATEMDPQQRLFLEVACEALADAGIHMRDLNGQRIGLFVGAANPSYHLHTHPVSQDPFYRENRATMIPSISARTAYHLNITGPNVTIQNNCASSTSALSMACDAIRLRRCEVAIVGGVSIQLHDGGYVTRQGQILSPRGECNPFDSKADGTVLSDAVTTVVLKACSSRGIDGTPVYANIVATSIGSDGAVEKAGFQVPSARGQAEVIKSCWLDAFASPSHLQYVELHGSATPIGDALEVDGLALAMKELGRGETPVTVGTVKGNVGNTQQASGLVSLIKVCKAMQHGVMPAIRGLDNLNPAIDSTLPIDFARRPIALRRDSMLAVSAAGWGGVNTHVLLEFPDELLQKTSTKLVGGLFKRQLLAAPRLETSCKVVKVVTEPAVEVPSACQTSGEDVIVNKPEPGRQCVSTDQTVRAPRIHHEINEHEKRDEVQTEISVNGSTMSKLQELWATVLTKAHEDIRSHDSFLEIGGDSISALKLASLAGQKGMKLSVATVFRYPRLADMAANVEVNVKPASAAPEPFSLLPSGDVSNILEEVREQCGLWPEQAIRDAYPCTTLQEGLMALSVTQPGSYILQSVFELPDDVNITRFKAAWEMTVKKCTNLRTRIILIGDRHIQAEITEDVLWRSGEKAILRDFLKECQNTRMSYGTPLSRYALIEGQGSKPKQYFIWTAHHAVFDGWSMQTVMAVFTSAYERMRMPNVYPFSSFVKYTMSLKGEASEEFWKRQLSGAISTPLPFIEVNATGKITKTLKRTFCPQWRSNASITPATVIKAAWAVVLAYYCETDDVCFGTISSGRQAPLTGVETLTGPTIATVPVRVCVRDQQRLTEFLREVQSQSLEMVPFEQYGLQNISKINQDAKAACAFSSLLAIQPMSRLNGARNDTLVPATLDEQETDEVFDNYFTYPLVAQAKIYDTSISFEVTYKADVVPEDRVVALGHHLESVITQLLCYNELPEKDLLVQDLSVAGSWDLAQATRWNDCNLQPVNKLVHDMVSEQAHQTPIKDAIYSKDVVMTYGDLEQASTRLGRQLSHFGVRAEVAVPICFEKSAWTIVAMLGVLKAGGAFLPLDPSHPVKYLKELVGRSGANIILASPETEKLCLSLVPHVVVVSSTTLSSVQETLNADESLVSQCTPSNSAYIIFSSGSTGVSKGIVLEHSAVCSSLLAHGKQFGITAETRFFQFANYIFDASISEILGTLVMGGTVCVPSEEARLHDTAAFMTESGVNTAMLTPSFVKTLHPCQVPTLKHLFVGGESLSKDIVERWSSSVKLTNAYGPAEGCVYATSHTFQSMNETPSNIGRGINYSAWVVDQKNPHRLAPIGCAGELVLQGPGIAREYLNDPEKTRLAFLSSAEFLPLERRSSISRFYRTGDLVRYNVDGDLEYISRKDTAIKLRGQRIDLTGIEYHVKKSGDAEIGLAVVDVLHTESSDILAAFVRLTMDDTSPTTTASSLIAPNTAYLRHFFQDISKRLSEILPRSMIPTHFFPVTRIPQVVSGGKINRRMLREEAQSLPMHELLEYSAVQNAPFRDCSRQIEVDMRAIWTQVLGLPAASIGVDDDFYDLGGDSIQVVTLIHAIYEKFRTRLPISTLRKGSATISVMASLVETPQAASKMVEAEPVNVMAHVEAITSASWSSENQLAQCKGSTTTLCDDATVFLTGATGFLGTQLLNQLLRDSKVITVIALVRSTSSTQGLERIKKTATLAGWWNNTPDSCIHKLKVWVGDLSSPQLGLDAKQWDRICGESVEDRNVDAIIHNGAAVNWIADYERLRAANVESTVQLLRAAVASPAHPKFTFISGGIKAEPKAAPGTNAAQVAKANGYAQTKFVAETAVHDIAMRLSRAKGHDQNRISVVKPGLIIGTTDDGVANLDDFIWRVAGTAAGLGIYPEESDQSWIYVESADTLAATIIEQLHAKTIENFIDSRVGLPANQFWESVNSGLDIACEPVSWEAWQSRALEQMRKVGEQHPLWPVQQFLGRLGRDMLVQPNSPRNVSLQSAITKNVQYLRRVGFIRQDGQQALLLTEEVLRR
ncbi:hypothetical protein QQS21_011414 [Conoideocrella luteorostrata]|uniref:Uncharacterized protein n=1 Tax=Conoideocrella luteorostrata TaxID=1105319 RepID=A0AAJ0CFW5_9HYPO|nr:hypothetical protein QQS21_011414 [Conoideocrella luteorostrata]